MLSTLFDVLGLGAAVASAYVFAGLGAALAVACPALMFIGYAVTPDDDAKAKRALGRFIIALKALPRRARERKRGKRRAMA